MKLNSDQYRIDLFFLRWNLINLRYLEYINVDDVIAFCLYLINKMRRNLINLRCVEYINVDDVIAFCLYLSHVQVVGDRWGDPPQVTLPTWGPHVNRPLLGTCQAKPGLILPNVYLLSEKLFTYRTLFTSLLLSHGLA